MRCVRSLFQLGALLLASGLLATADTAVAAAGVTYYVAAHGSDANDGRSPERPWRSLAKVDASTFQPGDNILFHGGDTFSDAGLILRGINAGALRNVYSDPTAPITVGSYGGICKILDGALAGCATIAPSAEAQSGILVNNLGGIVVADLIVTGAGTGKQAQGIVLRNSDPTGVTYQNIVVRNVAVSGWDIGVLVQGTARLAGLADFAIRDSHIYGSKGNEENGIQIQGPAPGQPGKMTNSKCTIEHNLVENIAGLPDKPGGTSGNGILIKETTGCISQFNVVRNSGRNTNTCGGPAGDWAYDADNIVFRFDETYGMGPATFTKGCDWDGFDLDGFVTNSTIEYSYAHDNWGAGFEMYMTLGSTWHHNAIRFNIAENNATSPAASYFGGITVANQNTSPSNWPGVAIYNNTVASNGPTNSNVAALDGDSDLLFANNILLATGNATLLQTQHAALQSSVLAGNDYFKLGQAGAFIKWNGATYAGLAEFRTGTGKETETGLAENPLFAPAADPQSCGNDPPLRHCPISFRLQPGSAMIGNGLDLASPYHLNMGDRDYFGGKLHHGTGSGYNIGADGSATP